MRVSLHPTVPELIIRHMARPFRLTPPAPLRENDVERACLDLLRLKGYYPIRLHSGLFKTPDGRWIKIGEPGVPDWVCVHATHPGFLLETKRPGRKLEPHQEKKITELRLGYHLAVAAADDVAALAEWLQKHESLTETKG